MFESIRLHGTAGAILRGYRPAATVRRWQIAHHRPDVRHDARWTLEAQITAVDRFQLRQRPLLFTAPRAQGFWCWPLLTASIQIDDTRLVAILGPPEQ